MIQIAGTRKSPAPSRLLQIHQMEIDEGAFVRSIHLPELVILEERQHHRTEQILNEDHFGLDKVKKRMGEFLTGRKLKAQR